MERLFCSVAVLVLSGLVLSVVVSHSLYVRPTSPTAAKWMIEFNAQLKTYRTDHFANVYQIFPGERYSGCPCNVYTRSKGKHVRRARSTNGNIAAATFMAEFPTLATLLTVTLCTQRAQQLLLLWPTDWETIERG